MITLYDANGHKNIMFSDLSEGASVQANQHLIVCGEEAILLDPGGHKIYTKLFSETASLIPANGLKYLFLSHQDPDIVASINGWLMTTDVVAYASELWLRFIPHFGVDGMVVDRLKGIPDDGMILNVGGVDLKLLPAHFLHSTGNFQIYDPSSKILYSGDLGASLGQSYDSVTDFSDHIQYMEGFHRRYMPTTKALKMWAATARQLDIEMIAPQHGAVMATKPIVNQFIDWCDSLECGADLMGDSFPIP